MYLESYKLFIILYPRYTRTYIIYIIIIKPALGLHVLERLLHVTCTLYCINFRVVCDAYNVMYINFSQTIKED